MHAHTNIPKHTSTAMYCSYDRAYESGYDSGYNIGFVFYDEDEFTTDDGCETVDIPACNIMPSGLFKRQK